MLIARQLSLFQALLIATFSALAIIKLTDTAFMQRLEWMSYDWRMQRISDQILPPQDIAVVLVDDVSLQYMAPLVGRWPWPRSVFADLVDFISLGEPRAIIFDMLFSEEQRHSSTDEGPAHDRRLIEATGDAANVFHAMQLMVDVDEESNTPYSLRPLPEALSQRFGLPPSVLNTLTARPNNNYLIPIDGLYQAATGLGVVSVNPDADGVLRRNRLLPQYDHKLFPALSIAPLLGHGQETALRLENGRLLHRDRPVPLDEDGHFLFYQYRKFNSFSASGLLESIKAMRSGEVEKMLVDPSDFAGKYVFIGASAIGLHDLKQTPLGKQIPGVDMHASILGNMLEQRFLTPPNRLETFVTITLLSLAAAFGIMFSRRFWLQSLVPLSLGGLYLGWSLLEFQLGRVVELSAPLSVLALCSFTGFSLLLFTEGREKRKIRRMFSRYVSPAALSVMVDQHSNYADVGAGRNETVSILFSDIRGFTTLSENAAAQQIVQMLNHYFEVMTQVIHDRHGTIDKFIGDAIMAVWGAPIASETQADDAVTAALDMLAKVDEVNAWLAERELSPIAIGVGIDTGEVVLGSIGSEQKADFTVIGDSVNLASRLEGLTKAYGCPLLISESTYQSLVRPIPCRVVDLVRVKGKHNSIRVYEPLAADSPLVQYIDDYNTAFEAYLRRDWQQALARLEPLPDEPLKTLYLHRCRAYQAQDPGPDWDGIHTMTSK